MQGQARHNQYMAFLAVAMAIGFGKVREADIHTRVTLDTDGAQEQTAAGSEWTASFFGEADSVVALSLRTQEPIISANKPIANEYFLGFRAWTLEVDQQATGHTITELMEIASKLSKAMLVLKTGPEEVLEKRIGYGLSGVAGIVAREDGTNAAAGTPNLTARGEIVPMRHGQDLDDPLVVFPGGSLSAKIHSDGPWTTTDDVPVELCLHGWIGEAGDSSDAKRKVISLSQAYRESAEALDLLKNRARV